LFENLKKDYERHGRSWRNRAMWTLVAYRFGRWSLGLRSAPARWVTGKLYAVLQDATEILTGVHLRRTVEVGEGFHLIHAATIFIHPKVVIGDRCGVMHNVTVGTNMDPRVPVIGNDVFIGCGASVLGAVRIGDNVRIAANTLVINDVPANSFCVGVPAKVYRRPPATGKRKTLAELRQEAKAAEAGAAGAPEREPARP
jgi:serine O-acetyltransferase